MKYLATSEFILNKDGSIYHLNLLTENVADTVILVGDPGRVEKITRHFDKVEVVVKKREFHTQTGYYKGKRMTVISTGIGTDNIDIVINELDALVNIDFNKRAVKEQHTTLDIIRIGTSGSVQPEIPVDSFVQSELAVGFDSLLHFYDSEKIQHHDLSEALSEHLHLSTKKSAPYVVACDSNLADQLYSPNIFKGFTATNVGFYGPQGRVLRIPLQDAGWNEKLTSFRYNDKKITNLEMETAAVYGLAKLLGHRAVSMNAIIANRISGDFTLNPSQTVEELIEYTLMKLVS